ncbi:MAG: methyltransferase domain-containing protein [Actinobacteria bacterium]|nr:methyltransferase domain-containing protein [Actinomycetota bacterium]
MKRNRKPLQHVQSKEHVEYSGHQELKATEEGLIGYSTDIVRNLAKKMGIRKSERRDISILEFGAGSGFLADIWRNELGTTPDCCEIDPLLITEIKSRGLVCYTDIGTLPKKYEYIYTSNVLEHIEDDERVLKDLYQALTSSGTIGIYVPAFPFLFSGMDVAVGHVRRYRRKELISKVQRAGFEVKSCHYADFIGYFASIALKIVGFKGRTNLGSTGSLKFYDSWVYPLSRVLDNAGFKYLVGKNLILIARKKT